MHGNNSTDVPHNGCYAYPVWRPEGTFAQRGRNIRRRLAIADVKVELGKQREIQGHSLGEAQTNKNMQTVDTLGNKITMQKQN